MPTASGAPREALAQIVVEAVARSAQVSPAAARTATEPVLAKADSPCLLGGMGLTIRRRLLARE